MPKESGAMPLTCMILDNFVRTVVMSGWENYKCPAVTWSMPADLPFFEIGDDGINQFNYDKAIIR